MASSSHTFSFIRLVDNEFDENSVHRTKRNVAHAVPGLLNVVNKFARHTEVRRFVQF